MQNEVREISYRFAVDIVKFAKGCNKFDRIDQILLSQLVKSATSIGANIEEACSAQSKRDFLAKMYIAFKEASEARYWLYIFKETNVENKDQFNKLLKTSSSIINLLSTITKSTRKNLNLNSDTKSLSR